jgi:glycosyltransferase involved in cell wall biosynthesis
MKVYREQLWAAQVEADCFEVMCWPEPSSPIVRGGRVAKAAAKYLCYPLRVTAQGQAEIVHFLDHSSGYLIPRVRKGQKVVATLHDLIPLRFGAELRADQVERFRSSVSHLQRCDAIVAVSEYSKGEAIELLGISEEKIHVLPNGVNVPAAPDGLCEWCLQLRERGAEAVVLSIGSNQERKNLKILPKSLRRLEQETGLKASLLRVGAPLNDSLAAEIREVCGEDFFIEAGRLDEALLWRAYANCDVVIVPSFYEGFGLPVIEALAFGKGVAASERSSLPEVGGVWAEYFDPDSGEEAGLALAQLVLQKDDQQLAQKRREAVKELTWRKHLEGIFEVYEMVRSE